MNIERMFQIEVRDKKRTASGVYHRASRRGYIRGGMKTPSDYLSKREKNKLNGEVKVYNMFEKYSVLENVPQINEIEKMSKNEKISLYKFLKREYSNSVLQQHWNISSGTLYSKIYKKYGLYEPRRSTNMPKVNGLYKSIAEVPSIKAILEMTESQRKGALIASKEQFSINALTKHWDISKYKLYNIYNKHEIIKQDIVEEPATEVITDTEINVNNVQAEVSPKQDIDKDTLRSLVEEMYDNIKQDMKQEESNTTENGFKIEMNGVYSKEEIENKLLAISNILNDKQYKISFSVKEI